MTDIHALSGAYATDALDDLERAQFERHLADCADCREEVASFRETAALIAETEALTPPASLRDGVLAGVAGVRPVPPTTGGGAGRHLHRPWLPMFVAAAVALILVAAGVLAWHPWSTGRSEQTTMADRVLHASDAVRVTEGLPRGEGELTLVVSPSLGRAVMVGAHVPPPPAGKTYQLWLHQPGHGLVSAGLMPDSSKPTLLTGDVASADQAAVSVEPSAGSRQPTTAPVAVFPLTARRST